MKNTNGLNNFLITLSLFLFICNLYLISKQPKKATLNTNVFEFDVTKAKFFDNKKFYSGKAGGVDYYPRLFLGDTIKFNQENIGTITEIVWDKTREAIEIQFVSENKIYVGQNVYVDIIK